MTPKEKLDKFVETNYQKEKEKYFSGMKSDYLKWEDLKEELVSLKVNKELEEENNLFKKFIKDRQLKQLFEDYVKERKL